MPFDFATPLLGDFACSLDSAFGDLGGWLIGHLILIALASLIVLSIGHRDILVRDLDLSSRRVGWWSILLLVTAAQYAFYASTLDFPAVGAISTSVGTTLFIGWTIESMAPARA